MINIIKNTFMFKVYYLWDNNFNRIKSKELIENKRNSIGIGLYLTKFEI